MSLLLRFSADLDRDRVRKGCALEAVAKHQFDKKATKDQGLEDHLLYWGERQFICCATRMADVAADLLTISAASVPSEVCR